jgi:AraC-like DNA-binding protein
MNALSGRSSRAGSLLQWDRGQTCNQVGHARSKRSWCFPDRGALLRWKNTQHHGQADAAQGVSEYAVIGMPDERSGESVRLYVVKAANATLDEAMLVQHCRAHLATYKVPRQVQFLTALPKDSRTAVLEQVHQMIWTLLPTGRYSVEQVAARLGRDRRTLHRHSREGATFSTLLDQVRRELATRYLANPHHPLSEIAGVLEFSELSAFSRWFSRLFDCSPSSFRRFNAL